MQTPTLQEATVAIVGMGFMGGSLGRALDGRCARRLGSDSEPSRSERAVELGVIDEAATTEECAARADVLVFAAPVQQVVADIARIGPLLRDGAVMTDVGSTKGAICDAMATAGGTFAAIGGHPMCGSERGALAASRADLFEGATWVLVPTIRTTPEAASLARELVEAVGANALELAADVHDRAAAAASHAPYVVAQALVAALDDADATTDDAASAIASTGFAGATRVAGGDLDMWLDILATNGDAVRDALADVRARLDQLDAAIDDPHALELLLARGRAARRALD